MNGIEPNFCIYFKHMINFETIEHLNISYNWIGMEGLEHIREHFKMFKCLKILNLTSNKLFLLPNHQTENLRDMLLDVKDTLEELHLGENTIEKADFDILAPGLASLYRLKYLNCTKNRIPGSSLRIYLDLCLQSPEPSTLESLHFRQNDLRDDGVSDLLDRVLKLPTLNHVNVISNKLTYFILPKMT
jgi:Ran GTPase-activating protein (RanGAP) involved in mRNA processing and transport